MGDKRIMTLRLGDRSNRRREKEYVSQAEENDVQRKATAKRQLYLARVLDPTPSITLHLCRINEREKKSLLPFRTQT